MAMETTNSEKAPDWISKCVVAGTKCRYYPNDERGPAKHEFSPKGHLMRHVLASGFKAWRYTDGGPYQGEEVTLSEVAALVNSRQLTRCQTYKDAEFDVEGIAKECGLWILWRGRRDWTLRNHVQVLAPCHRLIAELRAEEIKQHDLARSARDPKTQPKTMKTRDDIL